MESSASFVQHDEFLDVLSQPFPKFLSDPIEKQSAMSKRGQEATSDGKAKTNGSSEGYICQLGVTQLVEREGEFSARLGTSGQSGERR